MYRMGKQLFYFLSLEYCFKLFFRILSKRFLSCVFKIPQWLSDLFRKL